MIVTFSLSALAAGLLSLSLSERRMNGRHALWIEAKNAAETLVEYGFAQLRHKFETRTTISQNALAPTSPDALKLPNATWFTPHVDTTAVQLVGGTVPPVATWKFIDPNDPANEFDPMKGRFVLARDLSVFGHAVVAGSAGAPSIHAYVMERLSVRDTPLFAHAIFYNLDLEIFPGPHMTIKGPVHTNGDLFISSQSGNSLDFNDSVSVAGHVLHAWKSGVRGNNNSETLGDSPVNFTNRSGQLVNMKSGTVWKDSKMGGSSIATDFRSYASNTWHGNLQTAAHGIQNYKPVAFSEYRPDDPATAAYDPVNSGHDIIERPLAAGAAGYSAEKEKQKMSTKACLYFQMNASGVITAKKKDGSAVTFPANLVTYTASKMMDRRRGYNIGIADFNVGKLKALIESPVAGNPSQSLGNFNPATEWNGIVYFDCTSSDPELNRTGVRLYGGEVGVSGAGIPSRGADPGFTFATNNALYIKGHFNADGSMDSSSSTVPETDEVPVAIYGDSVTLLSTTWNDATSKTTNKPNAGHTEVAAAIVTGLVPTNAGSNTTSSGGAHNLPRFLENWSSKNLYIRGSLVALYECETDLSTWSTAYYGAPNRLWGFNQLLAGGVYPPGTPLFRTYRRTDYRNLSKNEYDTELATLPWTI